MNPIVTLILAIICVSIFVISIVNLVKKRNAKKKAEQTKEETNQKS